MPRVARPPLKENGLPTSARRSTHPRAVVALIAGVVALPAHACWEAAAQRYNVSSDLLYAIARTESGLDPQAVGRNRDGSRALGLMQINSRWLPRLAAHGIEEHDLFDPCISIHVGAWILADNVARLGNTWDAVGAYNAASPARREAYVDKVRRHLQASRTPERSKTDARAPTPRKSSAGTHAPADTQP